MIRFNFEFCRRSRRRRIKDLNVRREDMKKDRIGFRDENFRREFSVSIRLLRYEEYACTTYFSECSSCSCWSWSEHREHKLLTRFFYVYITVNVFLDRSFVLNSCNSQYNQFYCFNYLQISVYSSKEFVTLVYLCLYLVLLLEQPLQHGTI